MTRICLLLSSLIVLAARASGDAVTAGSITTLLAQTTNLLSSVPSVATAPSGESMVTWIVATSAPSFTLRVAFLNRAGVVVSGPTTITLTGTQAPYTATAGASPLGFMLVFEAAASPTSNNTDIFFRTFTLTGLQTGGGQANTLTTLQETRPSCDGFSSGDFAISWVRKSLTPGQATSGVYVRRFGSSGNPVDPAEVRVDTAAQGFGAHDASGVSTWPSGRIAVVWMDGPSGGAVGAPSPDGHGQAVLARILDFGLQPVGAQFVANSVTALDQFEPVVACDDRNRCVIGWCGDTNIASVDAYVRRFDDNGAPVDAADVNLTPTSSFNQFLMSVAMTSGGEAAATWMDTGQTPGETGARTSFARLSQQGTVIETRVIEPGAPSAETHSFPRIGSDQNGNLQVAHQVNAGTGTPTIGVRTRRFSRNQIVLGNLNPPVGGAVSILLDSPSDPSGLYAVACSLGQGPILLDTRAIRLTYDFLFDSSVFQGGYGIFISFQGALSPSGTSNLPAVLIPNLPSLSNTTFYFAFATGAASAPNGINTISDTVSMTVL